VINGIENLCKDNAGTLFSGNVAQLLQIPTNLIVSIPVHGVPFAQTRNYPILKQYGYEAAATSRTSSAPSVT
jgi:hypothetical protein